MNIQNRNQLSCKQGSVDEPVPLRIKITYIPFLILLVLKIGSPNSIFYDQLSYIVFFIWFFICFFFNPNTVASILSHTHYRILLVFLLYVFAINGYANGVFTAIKATGGKIQILSPIFMYEFYSRYKNKKANSVLLLIIIGIFVFFSIQAIHYLNLNPMLARDIISIGIDEVVMMGEGYALAYGLMTIVPCILFYLLIINSKHYKNIFVFKPKISKHFYVLAMLSTLLLFWYVILKSLFATSVLLTLFGCIVVILYVSYKLIQKRYFWGIVILSLIILLAFNQLLLNLVRVFLENNEYNFLAGKLDNLIDTISIANASFDHGMGARLLLYSSSLNVFLSNFIWGIGYKYNLDGGLMMSAGLGNHSEWLDTLATFGIFGMLFVWFIISARKAYHKRIGFQVAFLLFFVMGFVNPTHVFTIYFATFFLVPKIDDHFAQIAANNVTGRGSFAR